MTFAIADDLATGTALARLRSYLAQIEMPLDSRLPPERELAETLGVTRAGLRKALAVLESENQIWRHVGKGTFIGSRPIETMADVATTLQLPVLLVVGLRLGCLNHALLTAQAIEASGLQLAGWIANHVQPHFEHAAENVSLLERRLHAPLLESVAFNASAFGSVTALRRLVDASRLW